jgi:hypothetical protein
MVKRILLGILFFFCQSLALAQDRQFITYSEKVTFSSCEFIVYFPAKTKRKYASIGGLESVMLQSVYDGKSPCLRAEGGPLSPAQRQELLSNFRGRLENQAHVSGIAIPEITIENTKLGTIGTYSGVRTIAGVKNKQFLKIIVGNNSLVSLLVLEPLDEFPSIKTLYFLNAVEHK